MDHLAHELAFENSKRAIQHCGDLGELKELALALLELNSNQRQALDKLMRSTFGIDFNVPT